MDTNMNTPFFNQLNVYLLNKGSLPDLETLADKLNKAAFKPCMGLDWDSIGFANPVSFSPEMVFPAQSTWRIALKKEEKVLPAAVVRDILEEKISEIQEAEGCQGRPKRIPEQPPRQVSIFYYKNKWLFAKIRELK